MKKLLEVFSSPLTVFVALPWLMILLITGTIAQRYMNLHDAGRIFFSSFILWLGPVPLPGGYAINGFIGLCLLVKFLFASQWQWKRSGTILAHLGVLVLILGAGLTAFFSQEGFMVIDEGAGTALMMDYHDRQLTITRDGQPFSTLTDMQLKPGRTFGVESRLPFTIKVQNYCRNCVLERRKRISFTNLLPYRGFAAKVTALPVTVETEDENNRAAVSLILEGVMKKQEGFYLLAENVPNVISFRFKDHVWDIRFARRATELPFRLHLDHVEKENYPGTDKARGYRSTLTIHDGEVTWPATIVMNKPLRHRGYTFYQSSYIERGGTRTTVLAVVRNVGILFPYLAVSLITIGLGLHLFLQVTQKGKRR
jgi:hypothetical protein